MTKAAYSVTRYSENGNSFRYSGIGKIVNNDLILKNGKRLEDVITKCMLIPYKQNEFKGCFSEIEEIEVQTKYGNFDTIETETSYKIWYKII